MVKGQGADSVERHPKGIVPFEASGGGTVNLDKRYVGNGDYALDMCLLGSLEPLYIARVACAVLRPVGLVLHQTGVFHSCKLTQHSGGGLVEILVLVYQTAGELHIAILLALAVTAYKEHVESLSIPPHHHTVH